MFPGVFVCRFESGPHPSAIFSAEIGLRIGTIVISQRKAVGS